MLEAMLATGRLWPSSASAKKPGAPARPRAPEPLADDARAARRPPPRGRPPRVRRRARAGRPPARAGRGRRSPAPRPSRSGRVARLPSGNWTAFSESFQLWLLSDRGTAGAVLQQAVAVGVARPPDPVRGRPARRAAAPRGRRAEPPSGRPCRRGSGRAGVASIDPKYGRAPAVVPWPSQGRRVRRTSWRILPGCSSFAGVVDRPWRAARASSVSQHLSGQEGAGLVAGDEAVPAEERHEPRDPRGHQAAAPGRGRRGARARRGRPRSGGTRGRGPGGRSARRAGRGRGRGARATSGAGPAPPGSRPRTATPSRQPRPRRRRATTARHRPPMPRAAGWKRTTVARPVASSAKRTPSAVIARCHLAGASPARSRARGSGRCPGSRPPPPRARSRRAARRPTS